MPRTRRRSSGASVELERLRAHWEAARTGAGRVVALLGAAGMGKTRLAAELAGEVHRAAGTCVALRSGAVRRGASSGPCCSSARHAARRGPTLVVADDLDARRSA